jgi:hypothetical protein
MSISDKLKEMAKNLESTNSEVIVLAETNETCMEKVAEACVKAAHILKECADQISLLEGHKLSVGETKQLLKSLAATPFGGNVLSVELFDGVEKFAETMGDAGELLNKLGGIELPEDVMISVGVIAGQEGIDAVVKLAGVYDASEDKTLNKVASVLDELLLTVAANPDDYRKIKEAQRKQIDEIKQKYVDVKDKLHEVWGVEDAKKSIEKGEYMKESRPLQEALSQRACPDHQNPMIRLGDGIYQCPLDKKVYNWQEGFKTEKGKSVPGGSVSEQTKLNLTHGRTEFDGREERLSEHGLK